MLGILWYIKLFDKNMGKKISEFLYSQPEIIYQTGSSTDEDMIQIENKIDIIEEKLDMIISQLPIWINISSQEDIK